VCSQTGWSIKHLPANIALVPSLSLHSSSNKSRFLFSLLILLLHDITTRHAREHPPQSLHVSFFFSSLLLPKIALQNRPRVHRALRVWILFSHLCFFFFFFLYHKHTRAENQSQEGMEFEVMRSEGLISHENDCPFLKEKKEKKKQSNEKNFIQNHLEIESSHQTREQRILLKRRRRTRERRTKCRNRF
jgi:hypothetical protein